MALTKVTSDVLADEFFSIKTSQTTTTDATINIDFTEAAVIPITTAHTVTLKPINYKVGMVKNVIVTDQGGTSAIAYSTADSRVTKVLNGTYSNTSGAVNFLQIICVGTNKFYITISQEPTS